MDTKNPFKKGFLAYLKDTFYQKETFTSLL